MALYLPGLLSYTHTSLPLHAHNCESTRKVTHLLLLNNILYLLFWGFFSLLVFSNQSYNLFYHSFDPEPVHQSVLSALQFLSEQERTPKTADETSPATVLTPLEQFACIAAAPETTAEFPDVRDLAPPHQLPDAKVLSGEQLRLMPALSAHGGLSWLKHSTSTEERK